MENFKAIWSSINNQSGIIYIYHTLFGGKKYKCESIQTICNQNIIGIVLKGNTICIPIKDIIEFKHTDNELLVKSDRQQIKIILKKKEKF